MTIQIHSWLKLIGGIAWLLWFFVTPTDKAIWKIFCLIMGTWTLVGAVSW